MAPLVFTISSARQKFFDLFEAVTSRPGRKVIITSRGAANHAVLVGESYLNELESAAKRLRDMETAHGLPVDSFRLVGSGRITTGIDDPLAEIRAEAKMSAEKKLTSLAKDR
jgi:prevent-host-death family protein